MNIIAICQGTSVLSIETNGRKVKLPNGMTQPGPLVALPHAVGNYVIRAVTEDGPAGGLEYITTTGAPVIDEDVVRITREATLRPLADLQYIKLAALAAHRWNIEVSGAVIEGVGQIETDDRAKLLLKTAYDEAKADAEYTEDWKIAPGQFATLTAAEIIVIGDAVKAHVSACFKAEKAHTVAILSITEPADVAAYDVTTDAAGAAWPAMGG